MGNSATGFVRLCEAYSGKAKGWVFEFVNGSGFSAVLMNLLKELSVRPYPCGGAEITTSGRPRMLFLSMIDHVSLTVRSNLMIGKLTQY